MFKTLKELLKFSGPVIAGQLGLMLIGAGDIFMATQHSTTALAAIGLAVAFANPVLIVGFAFQFAISPLVAKHRGEGKDTSSLAFASIAYALMLSIPFMLLTWIVAEFVPILGYGEEMTKHVMSYVRISVWSIPGAFLYTALREWLQAHEKTFLANGISILAVPLNLLLNWLLVFGNFGFPEMGVNGLAWASLIIRWIMGVSLLIPVFPFLMKASRQINWIFLREVVQLGWPTAIAMFFEVMAFCSVTLFVGKFGEIQTAAHNLVLTLASVTFMIPMAIASAVGVKVGHAFGEKNPVALKSYAWTGLMMSIFAMSVSALVCSLIPLQLVSLFGAEQAVNTIAVSLIFWMAVFQIFDGSQVTLGAILRGLTISRPVSVIIFIGYWIIGIPMGWYLGNRMNLEAQGFWIGLAISLALVAVGLFILSWQRISQFSANRNNYATTTEFENPTEQA
jgi:multidrug resistance protein, MATE family